MAAQHGGKKMIAAGCLCASCSLMRRVYGMPLPAKPKGGDYFVDAGPYRAVLIAVRDYRPDIPWWKLAAITGVPQNELRQLYEGRRKTIAKPTALRMQLTLPDLLPETRDLV